MDKVTSSDGTRIAYARSGAGAPLVVVQGTSGTSPLAWPVVLPALEEHFSVYAVERRGRGESGDGPSYALEREGEDIAAIVDSLSEPAHLLAHSFGGICALEAALLTKNLRKLVLYEGIPIPGVPMFPAGVIDRLQALQDAGDTEGLLTTFLREVPRMPPDAIDQARSIPTWPARLAAAHTIPREMRALERYAFDPARFSQLQTPTLLLVGGDSPPFVKEATAVVDRALPNSRIAVLPGQQHLAIYTAPDLFVREVLTFLVGP